MRKFCGGNNEFAFSTYIRTSHFGCELIVPSPYANVLRCENVLVWTGNNKFAGEMRNANVSGNGP